MNNFTPVTKGQKLLPKLTAEWYNHTIRPETTEEGIPSLSAPLPWGVIHCQAKSAVADIHEAVYISGEGGERVGADIVDPPLPEIMADPPDPWHWGIALTNLEVDKIVPVRFFGFGHAKVTTIDSSHEYVQYNLNAQRLETAPFGPARILHKGDETALSIIYMGYLPSSTLLLYQAPSTGIAARTTAEVPFAQCKEWTLGGDPVSLTEVLGVSQRVYNMGTQAVGAHELLQVALFNGYLVANWEDCLQPGGIGVPTTDPTDPVSPS